MAASLRSRMGPGQLRVQGAVGTAGPAAQALVVELDQVDVAGRARCGRLGGRAGPGAGGRGPERPPGRSGPSSRRPGGRQPVQPRGQPLVDVEHPAREPRRLGRAEQVAVVLEGGPAARPSRPGLVRRRASLAMTRAASRRAWPVRPAWMCRAPQQSPPRPGRATPAPVASMTALAGGVDLALPGVHHAAGEQARRRCRSGPSGGWRSGRRGRASRAVSRRGTSRAPLGHGAGRGERDQQGGGGRATAYPARRHHGW